MDESSFMRVPDKIEDAVVTDLKAALGMMVLFDTGSTPSFSNSASHFACIAIRKLNLLYFAD